MLVSDWIKKNIDKINFGRIERELKLIKHAVKQPERMMLQTAWIESDSDMDFEEFYQLHAVNKEDEP